MAALAFGCSGGSPESSSLLRTMGCHGADPGSAGWDAVMTRACNDAAGSAASSSVGCQAACKRCAHAWKVRKAHLTRKCGSAAWIQRRLTPCQTRAMKRV